MLFTAPHLLFALSFGLLAAASNAPHRQEHGHAERRPGKLPTSLTAATPDQVTAFRERVARNQVATRTLRTGEFPSRSRRDTTPSSGTSTCTMPTTDGDCKQNGSGPDGCIEGHYEVTAKTSTASSGVTRTDGTTFHEDDNNSALDYKTIPCSEYQCGQSYENQGSDWHITTFSVHIDHNDNTEYDGAKTIPFTEANTQYGSAGYCVVWAQLQGFNQVFGEGGQRPICNCA